MECPRSRRARQAGDSQALLMTRCWKAHRAWQYSACAEHCGTKKALSSLTTLVGNVLVTSDNVLLHAPILHCVFSKRLSRYACNKQAGCARLSETRAAVTPWRSLKIARPQAQRKHRPTAPRRYPTLEKDDYASHMHLSMCS